MGKQKWICTGAWAVGVGLLGIAASASSAATVGFGSEMYFGSGGSYALTSAKWYDYRFTATQSISVNQVYVYPGAITSATDWPVELHADSGGNPGALLGSATIAAPTANSYNVATLGSSASLTAGSVYHIVVKGPAAGMINGRVITGSNAGYYSYDGAPDPNYAPLATTNSGTTWSAGSSTLGTTFGVGNSTTHQVMGQAYMGTTSAVGVSTGSNIGNTSWRGEQFLYDQASGTLQNLSMRIFVGTAKPADDLYVQILDSSNHSLYSGTLLDNDDATLNSTAFYSLSLTGGPALTQGESYRLVLNSPGSSSGDYKLYANAIVSSAANPAGDLKSLSFGGSSSFYIQGTGTTIPTTWTSYDSTYNAYDATFKLTVAVPEPATLALLGLAAGGLLMRRRR
jgi:hypothetical protein